jgi:hypothetical protein
MPISKYFAVVGSALLVFLFVCDAYFRDDVELASPQRTLVARDDVGTDELRLTEDVTPAARVKETFSMFVPGDTRRLRDTVRPLAKAVKPQA